MKILLIHPYLSTVEKDMVLTEPLGLVYLASYLEHHLGKSVEIKILDLFALGYDQAIRKEDTWVKGVSKKEDILKYVEEFQPKVVGVSSNFTAFAQDSLEIARTVKEAFPSLFLIMGGAHVSMEPDKVLKDSPFIDCIVRGEGEETFCELIKEIMSNPGAYPLKRSTVHA